MLFWEKLTMMLKKEKKKKKKKKKNLITSPIFQHHHPTCMWKGKGGREREERREGVPLKTSSFGGEFQYISIWERKKEEGKGREIYYHTTTRFRETWDTANKGRRGRKKKKGGLSSFRGGGCRIYSQGGEEERKKKDGRKKVYSRCDVN